MFFTICAFSVPPKSSIVHNVKHLKALEGCFEIECVLGFVVFLVWYISVLVILNYTASQQLHAVQVSIVKVFSKQLGHTILLYECFSFFSLPLLLAPKGTATGMWEGARYCVGVSLSTSTISCVHRNLRVVIQSQSFYQWQFQCLRSQNCISEDITSTFNVLG